MLHSHYLRILRGLPAILLEIGSTNFQKTFFKTIFLNFLGFLALVFIISGAHSAQKEQGEERSIKSQQAKEFPQNAELIGQLPLEIWGVILECVEDQKTFSALGYLCKGLTGLHSQHRQVRESRILTISPDHILESKEDYKRIKEYGYFRLHLNSKNLQPKDMKSLQYLTHLTELKIAPPEFKNNIVNPNAGRFSLIRTSPELSPLDAILPHLSCLTNLKILDISSHNIENKTMYSTLPMFKKLTNLNLSCSKYLKVSTVKELTSLTDLQEINLEFDAFGDREEILKLFGEKLPKCVLKM